MKEQVDIVNLIYEIVSELGCVEPSQEEAKRIADLLIDRGWWVMSGKTQARKPIIKRRTIPEKPKEKTRIDENKAKIKDALDECKLRGIKPTVRVLAEISKVPKSTVGYYMKNNYV